MAIEKVSSLEANGVRFCKCLKCIMKRTRNLLSHGKKTETMSKCKVNIITAMCEFSLNTANICNRRRDEFSPLDGVCATSSMYHCDFLLYTILH